MPITVISVDALGQSFTEDTTTIAISCHGCKYRTKHYIPKDSSVTVEISSPHVIGPRRTAVNARVAWVQRPFHYRQDYEVGLNFSVPQNIWGITEPPEDWLPFCDTRSNTDVAGSATAPPARETPISAGASCPGSPLELKEKENAEETIDLTRIEGEPRDALVLDGIKKAIEASAEKICQSINTLTTAISEAVSRELAEKLDAKIDERLQTAARKPGNKRQMRMRKK